MNFKLNPKRVSKASVKTKDVFIYFLSPTHQNIPEETERNALNITTVLKPTTHLIALSLRSS